MRDFVLSGAELRGEAKQRFIQLQEVQAKLAQQFSEHVMDATDRFASFATAASMSRELASCCASSCGRRPHPLN